MLVLKSFPKIVVKILVSINSKTNLLKIAKNSVKKYIKFSVKNNPPI